MIQPIVGRKRFGIFVLVLLIAFPAVSYALCAVTLQWDANNPAPDGYLVFGREEGQNYDYNDPWWQGADSTITQCTFDDLREDRTYFFVVRAYVGSDVSGDSNEVRYSYTDPDTNNGTFSSLSNNSVSSAGGGGSGAGCFIHSLLGSE